MSPRDTPVTESNFVPLPAELPKMDDRIKPVKSSKDKPKEKTKVYQKGHKPSYSADTGYASGYSSPYLEERTPEQYVSKSKPSKPTTDVTRYETIDGKPRKITYITKDGKTVKYISRTPVTSRDEEYVPSSALVIPADDPYKSKYKQTKKAHEELQKAFGDVNETARFNYDAAKSEEAARVMEAKQAALQIEKLEKQLRDFTLQQAILESQAAESDRKRIEAEQKYEKHKLEVELSARRQELQRREEKLREKQWAEIEATESPLSPRFKPKSTLPPLITQEDRKATFRKSTDLSNLKSGYTSMTPIYKPTPTQAPDPFMSSIYEAQRDYDKKNQAKDKDDEDVRKEVRFTSSRRSPRARRESQSFYK